MTRDKTHRFTVTKRLAMVDFGAVSLANRKATILACFAVNKALRCVLTQLTIRNVETITSNIFKNLFIEA